MDGTTDNVKISPDGIVSLDLSKDSVREKVMQVALKFKGIKIGEAYLD